MATYQPFPSFANWALQGGDFSTFDYYAARFRQLGEEQRESAGEYLTRSAAVDTNAIEGVYQSDRGFTRTVAEQAHGWEQAMEGRGSQVRPAFDDAMNGYQYILDAATGHTELSEKLIRDLHATMMASQKTFQVFTAVGAQEQALEHGRYKTMANSPTRSDGTVHAYAPVEDTAPEMARLIAECRSEEFQTAHPVLQASYLHYAFIAVHPFSDGNGRVSRALASIYLYRNPGVPFVVFQDQRNSYYDVLELADRGSFQPFMQFVADKAVDAILLAEQSFEQGPSASELLEGLARESRTGSHVAELVPGARRLTDAVYSALTKCYNDLPSSGRLQFNVLKGLNGERGSKEGYEVAPGEGMDAFQFGSARDRRLVVAENFSVLIKSSFNSPVADYVIVPSATQSKGWHLSSELEVFRRDVEPVITESLRLRIDKWAQDACNTFVGGIVDAYRQALTS